MGQSGRFCGLSVEAPWRSGMLLALLLPLLAMSSSDEDEAAVIERAQARARALAAAAKPRAEPMAMPVQAANAMFETPDELLAGAARAPRRTCVKEKLAVPCMRSLQQPSA